VAIGTSAEASGALADGDGETDCVAS